MKEKAKLTDHSLAQLSHWLPYKDREGKQRYLGAYSKQAPMDFGPHPDEFVHQQSRLLYENIEKIVRMSDNKFLIAIGVDEKKVSYIKWLIGGTTKMRPRDFLGWAWKESRETVLKMVEYGLRKGMSSRGSNTGRKGVA